MIHYWTMAFPAHELELKEKLNAKYAARGKLLENKDSDPQVEVSVGGKEGRTAITITQKDHDISLLDSHATYLESTLNDAQVACTKARTKITSFASERDRLTFEVSFLRVGFKDFKEKMEIQQEEQAQELWLMTHGIQLALLKCLKSSEYQGILGHALGRAVDLGMQEGLEAGYEHGVAGRSLFVVDAYNPEIAKRRLINVTKAL
ncbi:hypothetical protein Tco_1484279 [Tanacetum coccineum]